MTETLHAGSALQWETPLYRQALTQFEQALPHAAVSAPVAERLRFPERSVIVAVPVRRDGGVYEMFRRVSRAALDRAWSHEGRHVRSGA